MHFQSPATQPITWWGIFNEPAYNGLDAAQYTTVYNAVVPAMLAVDPTIKFVALEFAGSTLGTGWPSDPEIWLPPFFAPASAGGVNAHIDVVAMHVYTSCNQMDTDTSLFDAVDQYVAVQEIHRPADCYARRPRRNARLDDRKQRQCGFCRATTERAACNAGQMFVVDPRGTSAYFAAWRPYVFSQFGKAGNQALYQWAYSGDKQYGEVDANGNPYLSYWVDRALATFYPSTSASAGPDILTATSTDTSSIETLATRATNGVVRVMIVDRAVHASTDNNGTGDPRTVIVDTSSLRELHGGQPADH